MIIISNFLSSFINFCAIVSFLTKLLTIGVIVALRAAVVVKLIILGISPLTSFILALKVALVAKFVMILILCSVFLTTSFSTTLLSLLNQLE